MPDVGYGIPVARRQSGHHSKSEAEMAMWRIYCLGNLYVANATYLKVVNVPAAVHHSC